MSEKGRPRKTIAKLEARYSIFLTEEQHSKLISWGDGADYLRQCIDRRHQDDRAKVIGLIREHREKEAYHHNQVVELEGQLKLQDFEVDSVVPQIIEGYGKFDVGSRDRSAQRAWVMGWAENRMDVFEAAWRRLHPEEYGGDGAV